MKDSTIEELRRMADEQRAETELDAKMRVIADAIVEAYMAGQRDASVRGRPCEAELAIDFCEEIVRKALIDSGFANEYDVRRLFGKPKFG